MNEHIPLKVEHLSKIFQTRSFFWQPAQPPFTAVDTVSFELRWGEILGLLGSNGAGKTTTIQMLLGTMTPTSGAIEYFGTDFFAHRSQVLQKVSFASTYIRLPGRLSIYENLDFYGKLYSISSSDRAERIEKLLKFFDLWRIKDRQASGLSAGETTRTVLAKAFLARPQIVLLDEPTGSLDPDIAHDVRHFVMEQRKEYGTSILFTSHNMDEVTQVCDRVLVLKQGKIIAQDTPQRLAATVSKVRVVLVTQDGAAIAQFANKSGLQSHLDERAITVEIDEHEVAPFLSGLAKAGYNYVQISIDKPTLEDYFLQVARRKEA